MKMKIRTAPELYAHAIAIEREAADRYTELAARMQDEGREDLARVFQLLADLESEHLQTLEARTLDVALPAIAEGSHHWLDAGAPETAARELVFRLMTPRMALAIALQAELRALAREMAADEQEHAALLARMLEETPDPAALASHPIFTP
jgi:rubrerythrin